MKMSYKSFVGEKQLRIWFDKTDGFIKINNGIKYKVLLKYDEIYDRIRYLISKKSDIAKSISHNFARIRTYSYNSLPFEKILTFHNIIILIKSVVNKDKNNYYYNIFLEKGWYKDKLDTQYFSMNLCIL